MASTPEPLAVERAQQIFPWMPPADQALITAELAFVLGASAGAILYGFSFNSFRLTAAAGFFALGAVLGALVLKMQYRGWTHW